MNSSIQKVRTKLKKLAQEPGDLQIASLKYCMVSDAEDIFQTFDLSEAESEDYEVVISKFDAYFQSKKNVWRLRRMFHGKQQEKGENIESYVHNLYIMAENCEFGPTKEERITIQFNCGLTNTDLAQRLEM